MPYADKNRKRKYDRELIARKRAAERERLAAERMAGWREMAAHPVANEWMSAEQVKAYAERALSLTNLDELAAGLTPLADLLPTTHTRKRV
jgi:hypothetical protein